MLQFYNSRTQKIEPFVTLTPHKVLLYVCGITPNNETHLGHAFTYIMFDVLVRVLHQKNYTVNYLQNVTDVNDDIVDLAKMEKDAKNTGRDWNQIADFWTEKFLHNMDLLGVVRPTYYIKASSVIKQIISMNTLLVKKGFAYENGGNLYFASKKFKAYGKLSHYTPSMMKTFALLSEHARKDFYKKHPLDFMLWMGRDTNPSWESPWGKGVPGWHMECSTMIYKYLGPQIDIHGGGRDLIFPHHESEIAQSESYTGKKPFVTSWMHIGTVLFGGEKMAKSLGNLILVEHLLKKYSGNAIRWYLLSHHYRKPWEYNNQELKEAEKLYKYTHAALFVKGKKGKPCKVVRYNTLLEHTLCHDLNTPETLYFLHSLAKRIRLEQDNHDVSDLIQVLRSYMELLGFKL